MRGKRLYGFAVAVLLLTFLLASSGTGNAADGKGIFDANKCGSCHQIKGPATEKTIADQLKKKAPELWYAGSKFKDGFLKAWLANPTIIRTMKFYSMTEKNKGDHPKLSAGDAASVADYLMTLKSDAVKSGVIKPKRNIQGRIIFEKKQGCYGCHQLKKGKKFIGGLSGPTLIGVRDRLNPDWIYAYFATPEVFKPVKDMPVYVGVLSDKDMKNLAQYVSNFK